MTRRQLAQQIAAGAASNGVYLQESKMPFIEYR